jgi:dephospho-CoA kinase
VRAILLTGMSGTGKSSALAALAGRGFDAVDTDEPGWSEWSSADGGMVWNEPRVAELLDAPRPRPLVVSGCVSNQGRFYDRFDAVVLLSAPADVLLERIAARTTNGFGKSDDERGRIRRDLAEVEPLLRATCTHDLDATQPLAEIVDAVDRIARGAR